MRVVLDTNVLVSALIVKAGKPAQILGRIAQFELLTTEESLAEVERVLGYPRIEKRYGVSDEDITTYLERLRKVSKMLSVKNQVSAIKDDPDDDKFLALAKEGRVDYIVSGDLHITDLGEYEGILILTPAQFLEVLKG